MNVDFFRVFENEKKFLGDRVVPMRSALVSLKTSPIEPNRREKIFNFDVFTAVIHQFRNKRKWSNAIGVDQ